MIRDLRHAAALCVALAVTLGGAHADAETRIANISQGTNFSLALFPDRETIVVDLLGRLWRLPASGGGAEQLTADDELARHPRVAPDGQLIVYQRLVDDQWDLWLLDVASRERRALLASEYAEIEPDFTSDGRAVVFASNRTGAFSLWRIELETGLLTQLTAEPGDASFPTVSAHGEIAYVRHDPDGWSLRALLPTGVSVELLRSAHRITAPSWRDGGGVVVFNEQRSGADGASPSSELKMLVLSAQPVVKALTRSEDVFESRVAWLTPGEYLYAADGRIWRRGIAYVSREVVHLFAAVAVEAAAPPFIDTPLDAPGPTRVRGVAGRSFSSDGNIEVLSALGDVWLVERRGAATKLTDDAFLDVEPQVAPDGSFAVFVSDRGGEIDLWRMTLPDGALTQLTRTPANERSPAVSADGRSIAFLETDGLDSRAEATLRVFPAAGGTARTVAGGLVGATALDWDDAERITVSLRDPEGRDAGRLAFDAASGRPAAARLAAAPLAAPRPLPELDWFPASAAEPYVIQVGRLFDAIRSDYIRHVDVHIEGQRIKAIVARGMLPLPDRVIDLRDATVIPGLIDVNAEQSPQLGARLGAAWLAHGITTVREVARDVPAALERAESWASGRRLGPRLIVSPAAGVPAEGATPDEDAGGRTAPYPVPIHTYPNLKAAPAVFRAPHASAAPARAAAAAYRTSPLGLIYDDVFNTVIESRTVVASSLAAVKGVSAPTPALRRIIRHPIFARTYTEHERARWLPGRAATAATLDANLVRLIRAGGRVAAGSESPRVPYGLGLHLDMVLLAEAGIPADQVLRIATAGNALALGLERQLGTLKAGKLADFVIVEGNPLGQIADALNVVAVVRGGVLIEQTRLSGP